MRISKVSNETDRMRLLGLLREYAYQERDVTLASGQKSHFYIDCKQTAFLGEGASLIGRLFYHQMLELEERVPRYVACGGMALGAVPLALSLSMTAFAAKREFPSLAVRKEAKSHGTASFVEGALSVPKKSRVLLVEDVITTGGSTIQAAQRLRDFGIDVDTVLALVDRQAGGEDNLQKSELALYSLFDLSDFPQKRV